MKVPISKFRQRGFVEYDPRSKELTVEFPDEDVRLEVEGHLTTAQAYRIPESQELDDFREELAVPTDSLMHMELALSALWSHTEAFVHWDKEEA